MDKHEGTKKKKNRKQENVLTITKALNKTTNCNYCGAKKSGGHDKIFRALRSGRVPLPTFSIFFRGPLGRTIIFLLATLGSISRKH